MQRHVYEIIYKHNPKTRRVGVERLDWVNPKYILRSGGVTYLDFPPPLGRKKLSDLPEKFIEVER